MHLGWWVGLGGGVDQEMARAMKDGDGGVVVRVVVEEEGGRRGGGPVAKEEGDGENHTRAEGILEVGIVRSLWSSYLIKHSNQFYPAELTIIGGGVYS